MMFVFCRVNEVVTIGWLSKFFADLQKQLAGLVQCVKLLITAHAKELCLESIEYKNGE